MQQDDPVLIHTGDGTELRYQVHRPPSQITGTGVPALLVHGFASSGSANWVATGWVRSLGRAGIVAITVDLRGHGGSARPHDPDRYRLGVMVDDLRAVLEAQPALTGGQVDVVGYSLGGRLAAELAADLPTVRRLVIGGQDGRPIFRGVSVAALHTLLRGGTAAQMDAATARIARIAAAHRGNDTDALAALVAGLLADPAGAERIALPHVPALVAAGEADPLASGARRWAAAGPRASFLEIPGRDHISAVTSAVFRSAAAAFLAR